MAEAGRERAKRSAQDGPKQVASRAHRSEPRERSEPAKRLARERVGEFEGRSPSSEKVASRAQRSEPRERSEPAKRLARDRVGEFEGRSPSSEKDASERSEASHGNRSEPANGSRETV